MGPHSFERGNMGQRNTRNRHTRASMGPHSFERGNIRRTREASLQWGLTHSSEETYYQEALFGASMGPHSFERGNLLPGSIVRSRAVASMGPHSFERGNGNWRLSCEIVALLQWGLTHSSEETSAHVHDRHICRNASMGPHSFERGNSILEVILPLDIESFNGASLIRARKQPLGLEIHPTKP